VAVLDPAGLDTGLLLAQDLRREGFAGEAPFAAKSTKSQMRAAGKSGARFCLLLGPDELAGGTVVVKDMTTSSQESLPRDGRGRLFAGPLRVVLDVGAPPPRPRRGDNPPGPLDGLEREGARARAETAESF